MRSIRRLWRKASIMNYMGKSRFILIYLVLGVIIEVEKNYARDQKIHP
jgi:hypothetical protein